MARELTPGTVLSDSYRLVDLIGRGGMGAVWLAEHTRLPKRVAVKVLHAATQADAEACARFRREAEIASRIGHPNIVEVHDFNTLEDGTPYLVLDLLEGESLRDRLVKGGAMPLALTIGVLRQVASALHAAHAQGVIHRDLKPENVFLCRMDLGDGTVEQAKVLDFGISKIQGSQTILTQDSTVLGTPQYMAPEQATGLNSQIDARTDEFALAAMAYEMLSGQAPFAGHTLAEVVYRVVHGTPPALASLVPGLPAYVIAAIERGLAKDPAARFPDIASFTGALSGRELITPPTAANVDAMGQTVMPGQVVTGPPDPLAATVAPADLLTGPPDPHAATAMAQTGGAGPTQPPLSGPTSSPIAPTQLESNVAVASAGPLATPPPAPVAAGGGRATGVVLALALAAGVGVTVYLLRGGPKPEPRTMVQGAGVPDAAPARARRDAAVTVGARGADAGLAATVDAGASPPTRRRRRGVRPAGRWTLREALPSLPVAVQKKLTQARHMLRAGHYGEARRLALQSMGLQDTLAGRVVIVASYCGQRDMMKAPNELAALPALARPFARRWCKRLGMDL